MKRFSLSLLALVIVSLMTTPVSAFYRYGNWCGVGNNGKTPIDSVDAICKQHDECCHRSRPIQLKVATVCGCHCDKAFIRSMEKASRSAKTSRQRSAAKRMRNLIRIATCHCGYTTLCVPWVSCTRKKVCTRKLGRKWCIKKPVCKKTKKCKRVPRLGSQGRCLSGKALFNSLKKNGLLKKYGLSK